MRWLVCFILAGCAAPNQTPVHSHFGGWTAESAEKSMAQSATVPVDPDAVDAAQ